MDRLRAACSIRTGEGDMHASRASARPDAPWRALDFALTGLLGIASMR